MGSRHIVIACLSLLALSLTTAAIARTAAQQEGAPTPAPAQATEAPAARVETPTSEAKAEPTPVPRETDRPPVHVERSTERHVIKGSGSVGVESGAIQHGETTGGSYHHATTPRPRATPSASTAAS